VVPLADVLPASTPAVPGERPHRRAHALRRRAHALPELASCCARWRPQRGRVLVNTNGSRIARDDALLDLLAEHRERVEVYLQYDGVSERAAAHHRGADLRRLKDRRSTGCRRGMFTTLTMTAALGVNDDEIGAVVKRALDTPYVGGISHQPQFGPAARARSTGPTGSPTPACWPGSARRPRPGHLARPHRAAVLAPALLLGRLPAARRRGQWRSLTALIGHDAAGVPRLAPDAVANRIADVELPAALRVAVKDSLLGLLSEQSSLSHPASASCGATSARTATSASPRCHAASRRCPAAQAGCASCSASGSSGSPSSRSWTWPR
jgi:hypothetical protein